MILLLFRLRLAFAIDGFFSEQGGGKLLLLFYQTSVEGVVGRVS
jgi:hypothetical protein